MEKYNTLFTFGQRVKQQRESIGMSQQELAQLVGYKSRSSINKIELGKNDVFQSNIQKLADALQTTPAYLMGLDELVVNENCYQIVLAYLRADASIKKIVDTALQPYFECL